MSWIRTWSGKSFDLLEPKAALVDIDDIANSLSRQVRFNGHTGVSYSVAEHSIFVSYFCLEENALWGLLHDASEAYIGDLVTPVKVLCPEFRVLETKIQSAVCRAFGLPEEEPADVRAADAALLVSEQRAFFPDSFWDTTSDYYNIAFPTWGPKEAFAKFLERFYELSGKK